jgi:CRISPR-associated protein (TIGR02584 family)
MAQPAQTARSKQKVEKNRRILLAVSGMSPQIITETLYALHREAAWLPDEVHLITTINGRDRANLQLLQGAQHFTRLLKELKITRKITFSLDTIHVIIDRNGNALEDLRTPQDNEAAADFITERIRQITADPATELHVSLAGGRKTMGFYAGYALSLFGRPQDRLSHVLVSSEYESLPDFFYPTRKTHVIYKHDKTPVDTSKATVWLAEIPFVRLRDSLPNHLLQTGRSFSETVDMARRANENPHMILHPKTCDVTVNGVSTKITPQKMAFYLWVCANKNPIKPLVEGEKSPEYAKAMIDAANHYGLDLHGKSQNGLEKDGMTKAFIETNLSRLNTSIKKQLGSELANLCKLASIKTSRGKGYALPENLTVSIE